MGRRTAVECGASGLDPSGLIEGAELAENGIGLVGLLTRYHDVSGLAQCRSCHHRPSEIVTRTDALQNRYRGLEVWFSHRRGFGREAFAHQPAPQTLEVQVARGSARLERVLY